MLRRSGSQLLRRTTPGAPRGSSSRPYASLPSPVAFDAWIEEVTPTLKPPVANKLLYGADSAMKVMIVGGPNERRDYHIQEGEELFFMLRGDMRLDIVERGRFKSVHIPEGHMFILPSRVPHSPQRFADTIGMVLERGHQLSEIDGMRWYTAPPHADGAPATPVEYEEFFFCEDLGSQLGPVIERFNARAPDAEPMATERPPIAVDDEAVVDEVADVRPLLAAAAAAAAAAHGANDALLSSQVVLAGREFSCSLVVGKSPTPSDELLHKSEVDALLWQLGGEAQLTNRQPGGGASIVAGDVVLSRHQDEATWLLRDLEQGSDDGATSVTMVFQNSAANM